MTIKNTNPTKKKWPLALIIVGVLVVAGIAGLVFRDTIRTIATDLTTNTENKPTFVFDTTQFPDWVTTGNTYQDNEDGAHIAVMSVHQCEQGSNCSSLMDEGFIEDKCTSKRNQCEKLQQFTDAGHCMVHFYHINRPIDPDKAIAAYLESASGFKVETREVAIKTLQFNTSNGAKTYQLHQYHSDNKGGYKQGVSLGYVALKDSHIEIKGVCDQPD